METAVSAQVIKDEAEDKSEKISEAQMRAKEWILNNLEDLHKKFCQKYVLGNVAQGLQNEHSRGNTKIGSNRRLHVKGRPLKPGTDAHREAFVKSRVQEPPPDNMTWIHSGLNFGDVKGSSKVSQAEQALISLGAIVYPSNTLSTTCENPVWVNSRQFDTERPCQSAGMTPKVDVADEF